MSRTVGRLSILLAIALIGVYAAVVLRGPEGIPALMEKRRKIRELQDQNATLIREIQQKRERIQGLKSNPATQQMEVRKELKLQKPGETTFMLQDAPPAQPAAPPPAPSSAQ